MKDITIFITYESEYDADGKFLANEIGNSLVTTRRTVGWSLKGEKRIYRAFQCMKDEAGRTVVVFREIKGVEL